MTMRKIGDSVTPQRVECSGDPYTGGDLCSVCGEPRAFGSDSWIHVAPDSDDYKVVVARYTQAQVMNLTLRRLDARVGSIPGPESPFVVARVAAVLDELEGFEECLVAVKTALQGVVATKAGGFTDNPYVDAINTLRAEVKIQRLRVGIARNERDAVLVSSHEERDNAIAHREQADHERDTALAEVARLADFESAAEHSVDAVHDLLWSAEHRGETVVDMATRVKRERNAAQELLRYAPLSTYLHHTTNCNLRLGADRVTHGPCNCGLDEWLTHIKAVLK